MKRTVVFVLASTIAFAMPARADEIDNCANNYEAAQRLRQRGELRAARSAASVCARDVCPAVLRKDCSAWSRELAQSIPTVRVRARGPGGCAVQEPTFRIDQATVGDAPVELDPGAHVASATAKSGERVEKTVTISIGDKDRPIDLAFESREACGISEAPPPPPPRTEPPSRGIPTLSLALGGTGVVALGLATWQGIRGLTIKSQLEDRHCEPNCLHSDVVHAKTAFLAADVLGAVGIVAVGAALYVWLAQGDATKSRATVLPGLVQGAF